MTALRIEIETLVPNHRLDTWTREARDYLGVNLAGMEEVRFYMLETANDDVLEKGREVFADPVIQKLNTENTQYDFGDRAPSWVIEVAFRPGVTDNSAHAAKEALAVVGIEAEVASGTLYFLFGDIDEDGARRVGSELLANELIQSVDVSSFDAFSQTDRFADVKLPRVELGGAPGVQEIALDIDDDALVKLSEENCLALSLDEMHHIRAHYEGPSVRESRAERGLPQWPTDVEMEVIAQSWSEHCKHKIFSADIDYSEGDIPDGFEKFGDGPVRSLYRNFIKKATKDIERKRGIDWLVSVFSDNAGIVRFDDKLDLCIKVETHNSPSALDPYGGALTGILGVNRDILGCGMGARPIANTDVFCFAPPSMPEAGEEGLMPDGLKAPRRIFDGVHLGVEDGGNKSGIPTVNGAIFFDRDYAGKPLVFVGTVGAMPAELPGGGKSSEKTARPGDRIVMAGGAIGADGIHGATFSSLELSESSPATAVQIGDPLTQKRLGDFLIEARDRGLFSSVTDNGAGGLSSSVGEMAVATGGAELDLALCPVKYPGLQPWELMVSESQERMSFAVPPEHIDMFLDLARARGVLATDIGQFTDGGNLTVLYGGDLVGELDLHFLHDSLPPMKLKACWDGPRARKPWSAAADMADKRAAMPGEPGEGFIEDALLRLLAKPNVASKETWVRRYDHEVQAATHIKPFIGKLADGPGDSGVIWLYPHGGSKNAGVAVGCGMAPRLSLRDTYLMAQFAVDEALRNVVAAGGDIDTCCLLDNFCWPDPVKSAKTPDGDYKLGQLVRACRGLYDICTAYGTPLVSGKDSMKNDFRGRNRRGDDLTISILPTLLVTAMARVDIDRTVTGAFGAPGDLVYVIGPQCKGFGGSEFAETFAVPSVLDTPPGMDVATNAALYRACYEAIHEGMILSCHDVSDGGMLCALAECMIAGRKGAALDVSKLSLSQMPGGLIDFLFNEAPGRFVVTVRPDQRMRFEALFAQPGCVALGQVTEDTVMKLQTGTGDGIEIEIEQMVRAWKTPM